MWFLFHKCMSTIKYTIKFNDIYMQGHHEWMLKMYNKVFSIVSKNHVNDEG